MIKTSGNTYSNERQLFRIDQFNGTLPEHWIWRVNVAGLIIFLLVAGLIAGCGKRKPPLPPAPKVAQRAEISGFQRGGRVILSWNMPATNAPSGDVQHIRRVDVYRLVEMASSPLTLSEEEFSARSIVIAAIPVKDSDFGGKRLSYTDTLQFAGQPARLRYAVRFVNAAGQKAAFSNFLVVEPEPRIAAEPRSLTATVTPEAIALKWTAPDRNTDGSQPINLDGFNVYRSESKTEAGKLLNTSPLAEPSFEDKVFEFGKEYFYFVRAVSTGPNGKKAESSESNIVEVRPEDTFPPSPPASITIAASPTSISLFFPPNPESDVVGYKIFRSEDETIEKTQWKAIVPEPQDANTYEDSAVESGKTYYYYIIAVDRSGNESMPSEVVREKIP
jgi:predicted small lipoprotein YifL/predicted phage tail protein